VGLPDPYPNEPNEDSYMMGGILMHKKKAAAQISSLNVAADADLEYP
jgi:hypothetical protein